LGPRTYNYDMLSRLTSAATPESGTTYYYYTTSGGALCSGDPSAVCRRTDARGTTTTYTYDALNRLTGKTYSDSTPPATFSYDQTSVTIGSWSSGTLTNPKGRLTEAVTTSSGSVQTAVAYGYDPVGRVQNYWQCTPYNCGGATIWQTHYDYDLAGDIADWTHPAGFTITNTISPAQRVTQISSSLSDAARPPTLAQSITYTPWGALSTLQNGCAGTTAPSSRRLTITIIACSRCACSSGPRPALPPTTAWCTITTPGWGIRVAVRFLRRRRLGTMETSWAIGTRTIGIPRSATPPRTATIM
jgi:YD repeat-containing protein